MNKAGKILTAFVAVATAGAIVGILYTTDKGSKIRRKIRERGRTLLMMYNTIFAKAKKSSTK